MRDCRERAALIAGDRERGASLLLAELLLVLDDAVAGGRDLTVEVARCVCRGQPAMAPLWNLCAAALADFLMPGSYVRRRAEAARAPRALVRAATAALHDALLGASQPRLITFSYSSSVASALRQLNTDHQLRVVCGESLPGGEGRTLQRDLAAEGVDVAVVPDTLLTTHLQTATAVVLGADGVGARWWTNKVGTYGVAAAAWFSGVPVYVLTTRDKAESERLSPLLTVSTIFERMPVSLVTGFLTEAGPVVPGDLPLLTERFADELPYLLEIL